MPSDQPLPPYLLLTTADEEAWRAALPAEACVMGSLEYLRIQERHLGRSARLLVVGAGAARVVYPFFLRPIPPHSPFQDVPCHDIASPEYTGPMLLGATEATPELAAAFRAGFAACCSDLGLVSEFAHLNPWHSTAGLLEPDCVELNREIVYIDLTQGEDAIWKHSLSSDTRRQTRQSMDAGVRVRPARCAEDVLAFHRLHQETMERRAAMERYYLAPEYFLDIYENLADHCLYMLAEYEGRIVAGGLYFQDGTDVYWHLSAVDMDFSRVRPVNAYHFETIKRSVHAGRQRLLCGGAFQPGDGVFRFKAGFSPLRVPFQVYRRILDPGRYQDLVAAWAAQHRGMRPEPGYFPAYRSAALAESPVEPDEALHLKAL